MNTPHKWAEVIKAWADGKTVEYLPPNWPDNGWYVIPVPRWDIAGDYRIKPEDRVVINKHFVTDAHGPLLIFNGQEGERQCQEVEWTIDPTTNRIIGVKLVKS